MADLPIINPTAPKEDAHKKQRRPRKIKTIKANKGAVEVEYTDRAIDDHERFLTASEAEERAAAMAKAAKHVSKDSRRYAQYSEQLLEAARKARSYEAGFEPKRSFNIPIAFDENGRVIQDDVSDRD